MVVDVRRSVRRVHAGPRSSSRRVAVAVAALPRGRFEREPGERRRVAPRQRHASARVALVVEVDRWSRPSHDDRVRLVARGAEHRGQHVHVVAARSSSGGSSRTDRDRGAQALAPGRLVGPHEGLEQARAAVGRSRGRPDGGRCPRRRVMWRPRVEQSAGGPHGAVAGEQRRVRSPHVAAR